MVRLCLSLSLAAAVAVRPPAVVARRFVCLFVCLLARLFVCLFVCVFVHAWAADPRCGAVLCCAVLCCAVLCHRRRRWRSSRTSKRATLTCAKLAGRLSTRSTLGSLVPTHSGADQTLSDGLS